VVVNELRGEKIDVIRWSPDPSTYIANALSPARVDQVLLVNPEGRQAHILVAEDQLSLAIGKEGQNVRLAARLTGWKIDIKDGAKYDYETEHRKIEAMKAAAEDVEEEQYDEDEDEALETLRVPDHGSLVEQIAQEEEEEEDALA
jgi:N utilization substance protein A